MNRFLCLLLVLAGLNAAAAQSTLDRAKRDDVFFAVRNDPNMLNAVQKARATLDDFLRLAKSPPPDTGVFALKVAISDGELVEYFWINAFSQESDRVSGVVNNEPRLVKKVRLGERITFTRSDIYDWMYVDRAKRQMKGNFTACALLKKEPPAEAEKFKVAMGLRCDD